MNRATIADVLTHNWWVLALRGLAAIAFGVLAFIWPGITLLTLIFLFGAFALLNGVLAFVAASRAPKGYPRFGSLILEGILSIAAGVIAFIIPGVTALALLVLIASWAIVSGIFEIVSAIRLRKVIRHEWLLALAGLASIAFGVIMILQPAVGALALVWWTGAFMFAFGILLVALAFRMRRWRGALPATEPATT
jgi:uncharacterized membrane protein HdeD (DUF308 family)